MLTIFGKFCRKLRIDRGELLKDMADTLSVTPSYLSAVEMGKRKIPKTWHDILVKSYSLTAAEAQELKKAIENSQMEMKMKLNNFSETDREVVFAFAREFKELGEEKKSEILRILKERIR